MELVPNQQISRNILELLEAEYKIDKPLPHITELIYCLTKSYYDRISPLPATESEILLFALGWGLEKLLLTGQRKVEKTGIVDGIHFTPDFLAISNVPGELKTTRSSSAKFNINTMSEGWKRQILSYMKCLNTNNFELVILFTMGNWKPPFPEIRSFRVIAKEDEINDNWNWLQERKVIYLNHINNKTVPPSGKYCFSWECSYCRYNIRCNYNIKNNQEGE